MDASFQPDRLQRYSLFGGGLPLLQPAVGAKTSLDVPLLVSFLEPRNEPLAELGTGNGAALLAAIYLGKATTGWGIELQPELSELARQNATLNNFPTSIVTADLRNREALGEPGRFRRVIANPPFRTVSDGRLSPHDSRRAARSEETATLGDFLTAAAYLLDNGGRLSLIFTARRLAELISELRSRRLEPKRLQMIHPRGEENAKLVLLEAVKNGGVELTILPSLFTHDEQGDYSPELTEILNPPR